VLLAATTLLLALAACDNGDDHERRVLFYSDRDGDDDVYTMALDGTDVRQLTNEPGRDYEGDMSPDGTTIVFGSQRETGSYGQLFLMDADGSDVRRLTFSAVDGKAVIDDYAHWSPDGKRIVFQRTSRRDGHMDADIWIIDYATLEERQLTDTPDAWDSTPSFTADSNGVMFESSRARIFSIYRLDLDTMAVTRLTGEDVGRATGGKESPDATRIMFTAQGAGDTEVFVANADGTNIRQLTDNDALDTYPHWSPDGARILFQSARDGNNEVYVMNADGTDQRRLTDDPGSDADPHWAPPH
jgi:Tol biopolymer transport system component